MIDDYDNDEPEEFGPPVGPPDIVIGPPRHIQINLIISDPDEHEIVGLLNPALAQVFFEQWSQELILSSKEAQAIIEDYQKHPGVDYRTARWMAARTVNQLTKEHANLALDLFYFLVDSKLTYALEELRKDIGLRIAKEFSASMGDRDKINTMIEDLKANHARIEKEVKIDLNRKKQGRPPKADTTKFRPTYDLALPICQRARDTFKACQKSPFRDIRNGWRKRVKEDNPDFPEHFLESLATDPANLIARNWAVEACGLEDYNRDYLKSKKGKKSRRILTLPKPSKNE